jgi:radical SAM superfamily enzyme YgiQ (UPF0313 family)
MNATLPRSTNLPDALNPAASPRGLKASGRVLLISCYELGHQPLGLAGPLAALRSAGFDPLAIDAAVDPVPDEAIAHARVVAIAVPMHTALRLGLAVAARARRVNPAAHVCFFGLYATLNADHLLAGPGDSTISGEVEGPLLALMEALDRGEPPETVPGVGTRARPAGPVLEPDPALRGLPPDRRGLPGPRRYAGLRRGDTIVPAGAIEATRGCHHECRHCPIPPIYGGRFVVAPRPAVVADGRAQVAAGARHLTFTDPDFFNGPGHGLRIMRTLREEFPFLSFDVTIKVEHLLQHRKRLPELAELGCAFVVTAVESLSDDVLSKLAKGHTRADVEAALDALDAVGVPMRPSLLPFTPWETLDGYRDLLRWIAVRDLAGCVDPIMLAIRLLLPPGSSLLTENAGAPWLGALDAANFTWRWTHPDVRMDALQRAVSVIVERATAANEPAAATFPRVWDAAWRITDETPPPIPTPIRRRPPAPGLTESWFC